MLQRRRGLCNHCSRALSPFGQCRRSTCPKYRPIWVGDWRTVLQANVSPLPGVMLVTVTAPGQDLGLAWDTTRCTAPRGHRCSGTIGCRVIQAAADRWHADHEKRWSKLNRAAAMRARRVHGRGPLIAAKTWETQDRGLDHLHLVVPYWTPRERARGDAYVSALKEMAPAYWFGFVDASRQWGGENGGARAAGYCCKYIGKSTGEQVAAGRPAYVGSFLTRESLITMRTCRLRRRAWHVLAAEGLDWLDVDADPRHPSTWLHLARPSELANPPPSLPRLDRRSGSGAIAPPSPVGSAA